MRNLFTLLSILFLLPLAGELTASTKQGHFRWRNDDGSEAAATYRQEEDVEDTLLAPEGTNIRLRLELYNENSDPIDGLYHLGYGTDGMHFTRITTDGSSNAWVISPTSHFSNGDSTTYQLSNSVGLSDSAGIMVSTNSDFPIALQPYSSLECEFSIAPTLHAIPRTKYYFKVLFTPDPTVPVPNSMDVPLYYNDYIDATVAAVSADSAMLNGFVNPNGTQTNAYFRYGTDPNSLNNVTGVQNAGSGNADVPLSAVLTGLDHNTRYYFQLACETFSDTVTSSSRTFFVDSSISHPSLKLWLRADMATSTTVDNEEVIWWKDLSGNRADGAPAVSGYGPTYRPIGINGKPSLYFNGSSQHIGLPGNAALGILNHNYEIFIAAQSSSLGGQILLANSVSQPDYEIAFDASSTLYFSPVFATSIYVGGAGDFSNGSVHLINVRVSDTHAVFRINGIDSASAAGDLRSTVSFSNMVIGVRGDQTQSLVGDIAEVLIYADTLTPVQRSRIESYLANKYSIAVLPVELSSFTASAGNSNIELQWTTATEKNNYGFEVERKELNHRIIGSLNQSTDESMVQWKAVSFIEGHGTTNAPNEYSFVDKNLKTGKYAYRLKQVDRDGKFSYSQEVEVTIGSVPLVFTLEQNYPNPFNPSTTIGFTLQQSGMTSLKMYDAIGREVATLVNEHLESGVYHQKTFDASRLASGVYFARLTSSGKTQMKKLILIK